MRGDAWGVYVHIPWCRVQCPYCGFYVVAGQEPAPERFVHRVVEAWSDRGPLWTGAPSSLYFGGGTPSRLPADALGDVVRIIQPTGEVTAEANPEDLDPAWLEAALQHGIDRISLGVQSLQPAVARRLGRAHTAAQAGSAMARLAASPLRSWSVDLIFAVPGQTLADLDRDIDAILESGAPHVSLYGLTIEPDTSFARARARGRLPEVPDDSWNDFYEHIVTRLEAAGILRYEISNFARPGHESTHNLLYWTDRPYLGLGPGAHSYRPDGARVVYHPDLDAWLGDGPLPADIELPDPLQAAADLLISGLRGIHGLSRTHLRARTQLDVDPDTVRHLVSADLLLPHPDRLALGRRGFALADGVAGRLLDTLIEAPPDSGGAGRSG